MSLVRVMRIMSTATVPDVAKKKAASKPSTPDDKGRKPMIAQLRGSEEFKKWVEMVADVDRSPIAVLIEKALIHYSKSIGVTDSAPRR